MTHHDELNTYTGSEIAVIGLEGRFPGADNPKAFWENLKNGVESVPFYTESEIKENGISNEIGNHANFIKSSGGLLDKREYFDASFFGFTPDEAITMNPQSRIFLECAWHALESAGYNPETYKGRIGIYAGASSSFEWEALNFLSGKAQVVGEFSAMQLGNKDFLSTRVAHKLNLRGPAIMIQSACSTSLVAIHLACQSILEGECEMALAGGAAIVPPGAGYMYQEGMIFSSDGHCRAFDARSTGTIGGSGIGIVLLKALEDALEDNDNIHAIIKGSAINNDGMNKAGYSAPSREGQTKVIKSAIHMADVDPETITFIETHGTGTELGDPIEIEALKQAFNTEKKQYCAIGSVKTNIGHLDAAAGVVGFIKTVLALRYHLIPPTLHFEAPNPAIDFENSPFYVNTKLREWNCDNSPLRAGVSSLGIGGTNAHIILEEAPKRPAVTTEKTDRTYQLILTSAKTSSALEGVTKNLTDYLNLNSTHNLESIAYTLQIGRKAFKYRQALVCSSIEDAIQTFSNPNSAKIQYHLLKEENVPVFFMFSGQGSQYVNMGLGLYTQEPVFKAELDKCINILETKLNFKIKEILFPENGQEEIAKEKMNHVTNSGPIKFSFEYAMAKLFINWGIQPYALIGHSFGEFAAAQIAGIFSLEDALKLVVLRGQLMEKTPEGAMLSVPLPEEELNHLLGEELALAAINSPKHCIVSGPKNLVQQLETKLTEDGYDCIRINFPRASHSSLMSSIIDEFRQAIAQMTLSKPQIPLISCVTGDWISVDQATSPDYWAQHMLKTVRFYDGISKLFKKPNGIFLQVSSDRGLPLFVNQHPELTPDNLVLNAVKHPKDKLDDTYFLLTQLGTLWLHGVKINWENFHRNQKKQRISLPTYPFKGEKYWIDRNSPEIGANLLGNKPVKKADLTDWFYVPSWIRTPMTINQETQGTNTSCYLVFDDDNGLGNLLIHRLQKQKHTVIAVKISGQYKKETENLYKINPKDKTHYEELLKNLAQKNLVPNYIAHFWSINHNPETTLNIEVLEEFQDRGIFSLIYLAQAIGKLEIKTPVTIGIFTASLHEVNGEENLFPASGTILGAVKILPIEYPNIYCKNIDITNPVPESPQELILIEQLTNELQLQSSNQIVCYRGNHRWEQSYAAYPIPGNPLSKPVLKEFGVYLITGGLGGIGLHLAEFIASKAKAKLILIGRTPLPPKTEWATWLQNNDTGNPVSEKINKIKGLEELGSEVWSISCDITNLSQMEATIEQVLSKFNTIDGVIHAAGVPGGGAIQLQNKKTLNEILDAKIKGTLILNHVLKGKPLDFFILCSSVSSIISTFGQLGYCAGNAFLDAFAEYNTINNGINTTSINWGRWKNTGMAVSIENKHYSLTGHELMGGMLPNEGLDAFERILETQLYRVVAIESDLIKDLNQFNKNQIEKPLDDKKINNEIDPEVNRYSKKSFQRPELSTKYEAPQNEIQKKLAQIMESFFGYDQVGIKDDFFELGGDSLKALSLLQRIHRQLDIKLSLPEFFANPTIDQLTLKIDFEQKDQYISIKPVEAKEYYALSSGQRRLYILQQMNWETTAYHVTQLSNIRGKLNVTDLELTLNKLIRRHESLRTSFGIINSEPVQKIHQTVETQLEVLNYSQSIESVATQSTQFSTKTLDEFVRPFDLSQAPLLRIGALQIDSDNFLLIIDMHHIITDGISHRILLNEFAKLTKNEYLVPLKLQYKDYSQWQQLQEVKTLYKKQEEFWLEELSGELPVLELPTDSPRPPVQSYEGHTIPVEMTPQETNALKKIAKEEGTTLFMVLLTIYNILLAKISTQEDIIVGIDVSGRSHADLEQIIGMFVNNLPLRNFPSPNKTFQSLLNEVKERTLKAMENQDYPFEDLVEHVLVNRDISRNPLFDVMFSLLEVEPAGPQDETKVNEPQENHNHLNQQYSYENRTAKFDLSLNGIEKAGHLYFSFEYCTKLFKRNTIERFILFFKQLISTIIQNPSIGIEDLEIIPEDEKRQLLYTFNDTETDICMDKGYAQAFEEQVSETPDRIAATFKDISVSYHNLNERSNQLAWWLKEKGIDWDKLVGIMCKRSLTMLRAILAIWKAKGAYIPIDTEYPEERINVILEDSGAICLLTDKAQPGSSSLSKNCILHQIDNINEGSTENPEPSTNTQILSYVIYTSGSTGKPKGAMVEQIGMMNHLMAKVSDLQLNEKSYIVQNASHTFDISVWQLFSALIVSGKTLIYPDEWVLNPELFLSKVINHQITILEVVPSYLAVLLEYFKTNPFPLQLNYLLVTGEEIKAPLVKKWFERYPHIKMVNAYGPTEASDDITHYIIDREPEGERIAIGKPLQNMKIYILDNSMKLCPIGIKGEIAVSGIGVGRGYLGDEVKTKQAFSEDPFNSKPGVRMYKTGDLGRWLPDGNIEFFGRKDFQVKIRGFRIELGEIESKLASYPGIKENVVIAINNTKENNSNRKDESKYLCAYYVSADDISIPNLKEFLMKKLPDYMVPSYFIRLEHIPLSSNGKINRKALPLPTIETENAEISLPGNKTEEKIAEIWHELLGIEKKHIGVDMNFFEMGGHSLKATLMASRINKEFQVKLPITEIFRTPTIRELANFIQHATTDNILILNPSEKKEYYPLSPAQKRLYFINLLAPQNTAYNQPITLQLEGTVDKFKLEETFKKLINRHESLRTSFKLLGKESVQQIHDNVNFSIQEYETPGTSDKAVEIIDGFIKPFDLEKPPLLRAALIKINPLQSILVVDIHHIITDGVSDNIMMYDFITLFKGGELASLKIQYKDYSQWQNQLLETDAMEKQEKYWLNQFNDSVADLNLPTDYPRPTTITSHPGELNNFFIEQPLLDDLRQAIKETETTPFIFLLAVYTILLSKYSRQNDIVVGSPVSGRRHDDLKDTLGLFINMLALRNKPNENKTVEEFLKEVKDNAIQAYENQDFQFDQLVVKLNLHGTSKQNPLFQVIFADVDTETHTINNNGQEINRFEYNNFVSKFDLRLAMTQTENKILLSLQYSKLLFKPETIHKMSNRFMEILKQILENRRMQLKDITITHDLFITKTATLQDYQESFDF